MSAGRGTRQAVFAVGALAVATFLAAFDGSAVQMILPLLARRFRQPIEAIQWVMAAYLLAGTLCLLPAGRAGDVVGRSRVWLWGIIIFLVGTVVATFAFGLRTLVLGRVVQGVGGALVGATSAPLVVEIAPNAWRGRALAVSNIATAAGLVLGAPVGAVLAALANWRVVFAVSALVGGAGVALGALTLPRQSRAARATPATRTTRRRRLMPSLHLGQASLAGAGLLGVLWAAMLATHGGILSTSVYACAGAGVVLIVLFVVREARAQNPLLARDVIGDPDTVVGIASTFAAFTALFTLTFAMPFFLVIGQRHALQSAGILVGAVPLGMVIAAPLGGLSFDRVGARVPCVIGTLLIVTSLLGLSFAGPHTGHLPLAVGLLLSGLGLGLYEPANDGVVIGQAAASRRGVVTATLGAARQLGMTIGVAIAAVVVARRVDIGATDLGAASAAATRAMRESLRVGAGFALVAAVTLLLRPRSGDIQRTAEASS
jgi:MFS family permease